MTSAEQPATSNAPEPDASAFFNLSSSQLVSALLKALPSEELNDEQKLYARATLANIANTATGVLAAENSLKGLTHARKQRPASSITATYPYESALYDLIDKGDVEGVKRTTKRQTITTTAHPNFSRSRELAETSRQLTSLLEGLSKQDQDAIQNTGKLPDNLEQRQDIKEKLEELAGKLHPREKRSRRDELTETALDFVKTAMDAAGEQVRIIKKRKASIQDGKKDFTSLAQLEATAALFPEYNNWFADGDGKRTCHSWDAELAVPATKRATYEQYLKSLKTLPDNVNGVDIKEWVNKFTTAINQLQELENCAAERMVAFNELQEVAFKYANTTVDERTSALEEPSLKTQKASLAYKEQLKQTREILGQDMAKELKEKLGAALADIYKKPDSEQGKAKGVMEDLYMKLTAFGNYAVHIQRRENARLYNNVFLNIIDNDEEIRKLVTKELKTAHPTIKMLNLGGYLAAHPEVLTEAVEILANKIAGEPTIPAEETYTKFKTDELELDKSKLTTAERIKFLFYKLSQKIENTGNGNGHIEEGKADVLITPLQPRELELLDDLGYFNLARLHQEAFKGGFVMAEFGQPSDKVLKSGNDKRIKEEVIRTAKTDMLLQLTFAKAMGMPENLPIIPLYEEPDSLKYAPAAQEALQHPIIQNYLLKYIGVDGDNAHLAKEKAVKYVDDKGEKTPLTAYQYLKRFGYKDEELPDIENLKNTHVLEGPEDMEACSDNSKRAGIIGAELATQSVREKELERAKFTVTLDGQKYMIARPKYLGQGGSVARATESPLDTSQMTIQGEHTFSFTPLALAHKMYHYLLGRLYLTNEAARGTTPSDELKALASGAFANFGNRMGLTGENMTTAQKELMDDAIKLRMKSTRDDPRYNDFLAKYGEFVPNFSARADVKSGNPTFDTKRAIGVAGEEAGIFSNVIALSGIFEFSSKGSNKGNISGNSLDDIKRWKDSDYSLQHRLSAATMIANFVNLKEKWLRGGIEYKDQGETATLTKNGVEVPLAKLLEAYKDPNKTSLTVDGATFNAADLVMAQLTEHYQQLRKGLLAVYDKSSLIEIIPEEHRADVQMTKELYDEVLQKVRETEPKEGEKKSAARKLLEGAYHLIFESGQMLPWATLLTEKSLYKKNEPLPATAPSSTVVELKDLQHSIRESASEHLL
jgi:hypothetical protein